MFLKTYNVSEFKLADYAFYKGSEGFDRRTCLRLRRGLRRVEDEDDEQALLYFGQVLCIEPDCAEAQAYHAALSNKRLADTFVRSQGSRAATEHEAILASTSAELDAAMEYTTRRRMKYTRSMFIPQEEEEDIEQFDCPTIRCPSLALQRRSEQNAGRRDRSRSPKRTASLPQCGIRIIDDLLSCADTVGVFLEQDTVALDMEGVDLGRRGRLSIVQVATQDGHVFFFDILKLGQSAFEEGRLRVLLQSESVTKIMFDCRADSDSVFYKHSVLLRNVCDLQVVDTLRRDDRKGRPQNSVLGLMVCLRACSALPKDALSELDMLKSATKRQFEEQGTRVWEQRPLPTQLLKYAARDVQCLWPLERALGGTDVGATDITSLRIQRTLDDTCWPSRHREAERDFGERGSSNLLLPSILSKRLPPLRNRNSSHCSQVGVDNDSDDSYSVSSVSGLGTPPSGCRSPGGGWYIGDKD
eukprot:TRINITY_DN59871_c0_g1_i1.p1 TRINITY_DN59871_c0_g1~~TRINITY_DN59871_c0_g1_i1.p1  ORF type:complete len:508 (+),score=44.36 TRINITY_DN59871_c0_g1_i1:112-1524(+)